MAKKTDVNEYFKDFKESVEALRYLANSVINRSKSLGEDVVNAVNSDDPDLYLYSTVEKFMVRAHGARLAKAILKFDMDQIDEIFARTKLSKDAWVEYDAVMEVFLTRRNGLTKIVLDSVRGRCNRNSTSPMDNLSNACKDEAYAEWALDVDSIIKSLESQRKKAFPTEEGE